MAGYASRNGAASSARRQSARRLLALAYILAVAIPPLGFGLGIVLGIRFRNLPRWHCVAVIVISILASLIWIVIITSGALNTPTSGY